MIPTLEQLRCAGVIEAIRISRAAFPTRIERASFVEKFRILLPTGTGGEIRDAGPNKEKDEEAIKRI